MSNIKPPKVSGFYNLLIVGDEKACVESLLITVMSLIQSPAARASPGQSHRPHFQTNATNTAFSPLNPCKNKGKRVDSSVQALNEQASPLNSSVSGEITRDYDTAITLCTIRNCFVTNKTDNLSKVQQRQ